MILSTREVAGFLPAMEGMRNPKNSWHLNDSDIIPTPAGASWVLGPKDKKLAQSLIRGGTTHSKFLRQIMVWVVINAPLYWWAEFDTYKVGVVRDSCSTMHTLMSTIKKLNQIPEVQDWLTRMEKEDVYPPKAILQLFEVHPADSITVLSVGSSFYQLCKVLRGDITDLEKLREMKKILPSSWLQRSTISLSYQNIRSMLIDRRTHPLTEWSQDFTNWAKSLPLANDLLFYGLSEVTNE